MIRRVTLNLDFRHCRHPWPVVCRWLLKVLLRRYGIRCRGFDIDPAIDDWRPEPEKVEKSVIDI